MNQKSKTIMIRDYLEQGFSLSPKEAYKKFGSMRLASIVSDLKKDGYKFSTTFTRSTENPRIKYARYKLEVPEKLFPEN